MACVSLDGSKDPCSRFLLYHCCSSEGINLPQSKAKKNTYFDEADADGIECDQRSHHVLSSSTKRQKRETAYRLVKEIRVTGITLIYFRDQKGMNHDFRVQK